jgi:hypothetical protein
MLLSLLSVCRVRLVRSHHSCTWINSLNEWTASLLPEPDTFLPHLCHAPGTNKTRMARRCPHRISDPSERSQALVPSPHLMFDISLIGACVRVETPTSIRGFSQRSLFVLEEELLEIDGVKNIQNAPWGKDQWLCKSQSLHVEISGQHKYAH